MRAKKFFPRALFVSIGFFIYCILVSTGPAAAATYYVATTGNDSYSKSQAQNPTTPWHTIQHAADNVVAGDTVIVKAGIYQAPNGRTKQLVMYKSGQSGSPITFKSEVPAVNDMGGSNHAVIDNSLALAQYGPLNGAGAISITGNWVVIDGFEVTKGNVNFVGSNNTLTRCYLHHIGNTIANDTWGRSGLGVTGSNSTDITIDRNIFQDIGRYGTTSNNVYGSLTHNDHSIYCGFYRGHITNNLFYNVDMAGGKQHGTYIQFQCSANSNYGKEVVIANNTFVGPHDSYGNPIQFAEARGLTGTIISNNLNVDSSAGPAPYTYMVAFSASNASGAVIRNNITNISAVSTTSDGHSGSVTITGNTTSYAGNPFVNKTGHNYRLVAGSTPVSYAYAADLPSLDLDSVSRPQGSPGDVGAYEYNESGASEPTTPTTPPNNPGSTNPVAFYKMDEGRGQQLLDSSGKGNLAFLGNTKAREANDPSWTTGMDGHALLFNGSNNVVTIPHSSSLDNLKAFTVSAWINPTASSGFPRIIGKESAQGFDDLYLCVNPATGFLGVELFNTVGTAVDSNIYNAIVPNQWNHVVITYDDTKDRKCHLYVNGFEFLYTRQDTMTGTLKTSANAWKVGDRVAGDRTFDGRIDNLRIYNQALSPSEIAGIYDQENQ